jgi:hypothetical protein
MKRLPVPTAALALGLWSLLWVPLANATITAPSQVIAERQSPGFAKVWYRYGWRRPYWRRYGYWRRPHVYRYGYYRPNWRHYGYRHRARWHRWG